MSDSLWLFSYLPRRFAARALFFQEGTAACLVAVERRDVVYVETADHDDPRYAVWSPTPFDRIEKLVDWKEQKEGEKLGRRQRYPEKRGGKIHPQHFHQVLQVLEHHCGGKEIGQDESKSSVARRQQARKRPPSTKLSDRGVEKAPNLYDPRDADPGRNAFLLAAEREGASVVNNADGTITAIGKAGGARVVSATYNNAAIVPGGPFKGMDKDRHSFSFSEVLEQSTAAIRAMDLERRILSMQQEHADALKAAGEPLEAGSYKF